jgi:3-deoxy-D-manno-octulosonic-acid transferase
MLNSNITITGDSRFDQILERKELNINPILPNQYHKTNNIIFGSYDSVDEKLILSSLTESFPNGDQDLKKKGISIFLVPHEIHNNHIQDLSVKLKELNFNSSLYSNINANYNIVIINIVGILADLYKYSNLAYVGGGFTRGVHSVIEPAIYNCLIGFGPNCEMLDEAVYMREKNLSINIANQYDLKEFIQLIYNQKKQEKIKKLLSEFIKSHSGSTNKILSGLNL